MQIIHKGERSLELLPPGAVLNLVPFNSAASIQAKVVTPGVAGGPYLATGTPRVVGPFSQFVTIEVEGLLGRAAVDVGVTSLPAAQVAPRMGDSFDSLITKMTLDTDFAFGTANAPAGAIAIPDLATLATYFNDFEDFTGSTTINSEVQRYKAFNAANHNMLADRLSLEAQGTIPASIVTQNSATGVNLNGTATTIVNLGLANTNGIFVGQIAFVQFKGLYYVSALVANTSVTLTAVPNAGATTSGTSSNNLTVFTPWAYATLAAAVVFGDMTMTLNSVPTGVAVGYQAGIQSGTNTYLRKGDARVQSIVGNVVTMTGEPFLTQGWPIGTGVIFGPAIVSGQIWSKKSWDLANGGLNAVAFDFYVDLPPGNGVFDINKVNTAALWGACPNDVPWGAWPAVWLYSADTMSGATPTGTSEIDIMELFWSSTMGPRCWTGGNVYKFGAGQGSNYFVRTDSGDSQSGGGGTGSVVLTFDPARPLAGTVRCSMIWTPKETFRYLNGVLVKADTFKWLSSNPAQIGINLACGSILSNYASNIQAPLTPQSMANQKFGIRRMRVWTA